VICRRTFSLAGFQVTLIELAELESQLVDRELELANLRSELARFERRYLSIVGVRYAELSYVSDVLRHVLVSWTGPLWKAKLAT
jgi:hypothetical protein